MDPDTLLIEIEEHFREPGVDDNGIMALVDMITWLASGGFVPRRLRTKAGREKFEAMIAEAIDYDEDEDEE